MDVWQLTTKILDFLRLLQHCCQLKIDKTTNLTI
jgi:hypothetical protein